jgi:hypothetical protein
MRYETKLLQLLSKIGYPKPDDVDWHEFMRCKSYRLYAKYPEFKAFLDKHTSFLPDTHPTQRWLHFLHGYTKPHTCPVCGSYIKDFKDTYCSHKCSTLAPKTGKKTGPKVDVEAKKRALIKDLKSKRPDYRLVEYRYRQPCVFKHTCGNVFEMHPRALLERRGSCICEHKKLAKHDKTTLQHWHDSRKTGYKVLACLGKQSKLQCSKCNHKFVARKFYNRHCPKCNPNPYATQRWDPEEYAKFIKQRQPKFKQLTAFVNQHTKIRFKHLDCGTEFETTSSAIARQSFRCPACSPKTCSSYRKFIRNGIELNVRGKEAIALDWILKHTRYTLEYIRVDSEGCVPRVTYKPKAGHSQSYYPDFYIERANLIVEVKDCNSLGLHNQFFYRTSEQLWSTNCAKAKAVIKAGYKFKMLLFDRNNKRIKLPEDWYLQSRAKILKLVKSLGVI